MTEVRSFPGEWSEEDRQTIDEAMGIAEPRTIAGRTLLADLFFDGESMMGTVWVDLPRDGFTADIAAIEAEARATLRAELAQQVAGLGDRGTTPFEQGWDRAIAAVLELMAGDRKDAN